MAQKGPALQALTKAGQPSPTPRPQPTQSHFPPTLALVMKSSKPTRASHDFLKSYYDVLELPVGATEREIKLA
jgi:hypothetical protein